MENKQENGFTLLEVMLAMAIFSGLSFMAWVVTSQAINAHQQTNASAQSLQTLQRALHLMGNDLFQLVPVVNQETQRAFFFTDEAGLIISTQATDIQSEHPGEALIMTVHWYVKNGILYRAVKAVSKDNSRAYPPRPMLSGNVDFNIVPSTQSGEELPASVEVVINQGVESEVKRFFLLPMMPPKSEVTINENTQPQREQSHEPK